MLTLMILAIVGLWHTGGRRDEGRITVLRRCRAVMGTDATLAAVVPPRRREHAEAALLQAEARLRAIEARMSTWLADSELGRLNSAAAGKEVPLSAESLAVLRTAFEAHRQTGGVFDVTCRPLVELWRAAGRLGAVPSQSELAAARTASSWQQIVLTDAGAVKRSHTARVDLGGIAKGYAIDRAAEVLQDAGCNAGLVDVGGDLRCFGRPPAAEIWTVDVQSSSDDAVAATIRVPDGAVATSGNYARFTKIAGRRYSHIVDPRSGRPVEGVPSVTVVAKTAVLADVWATALSVLGPNGLKRLPEGIEALMIVGSEGDDRMVCTPRMPGMLAKPVPAGLEVVR